MSQNNPFSKHFMADILTSVSYALLIAVSALCALTVSLASPEWLEWASVSENGSRLRDCSILLAVVEEKCTHVGEEKSNWRAVLVEWREKTMDKRAFLAGGAAQGVSGSTILVGVCEIGVSVLAKVNSAVGFIISFHGHVQGHFNQDDFFVWLT